MLVQKTQQSVPTGDIILDRCFAFDDSMIHENCVSHKITLFAVIVVVTGTERSITRSSY